MRRAAVAVLALAVALGGCATRDSGTIQLTPDQAADTYRSAMCRVLPTDSAVDRALDGGDMDVIAEAARQRAEILSARGVTISEQHAWPEGVAAVWQVDEALADELAWVLEVADAPSLTDARTASRPAAERRAVADRAVRAALDLPLDDEEMCR